ncbi:Serine/threonine protein kinase [Handroanthus impetiginosus]|uniref:Serine/threonine protein kinase n=1 Tax=Handroanthus impetiginosus TaxID=429701 RepID=A0A2G9HSS3_9LAMI|nr:Serine/threonine protein kinase [Handroanthus impetiginosus]
MFKISILVLLSFLNLANSQNLIRSGYVYAGNEFPVSGIDSRLFTHLVCAFAYINSSNYEIYIEPSDETFMATFTEIVTSKNPSAKTLLSIWAGKPHSSMFFDMTNSSINAKRHLNPESMLSENSNDFIHSSRRGEQSRKQATTTGDCTVDNYGSHDPGKVAWSKRKKHTNQQGFTFAQIAAATDNFSSENKLGEGGFGPVYKGELQNGLQIAVKRLSKGSKQGIEELKNELALTARLQHVNLLKVLGICTEKEEQMLIYEYMPNGSLDKYLFDPVKRLCLDWQKRIQIIEGITQGLLYLQEYSVVTIIHRDLKASNILLDKEMKPKISDFGIAKVFEKDEYAASTRRIIGTYGYIPPEYVKGGIYSRKYDVYSFGVLLLQIISGKKTSSLYGLQKNVNLLEHAYELWKNDRSMDFMDPTLDDSSSTCKMKRCIQVALLCVQERWEDRPSMLEVSSMLKNETENLPAPNMPAFSTCERSEGEKICDLMEVCSASMLTITQEMPR